ncbi:UDP-N-acetylgalactosamine-undecaprenyl-phosphate N-acetylgalactosaminephosphotransferase [Clostridium pasteurianum DSM 525 = ATCC 6013]|uniref:Exopolysaccharide biosynthesis polyprenyl glycosylphosphotransferase n=1 Tax=Clostridium pasteurianum DSM 525 = ATCC 6013 TaxID=1262449 RepID=A0A0H3J9I2_CLOPA|nr:sugar transferase [Clostridium pasteurianum]AJA47775.1 UDP-N-acetylgalactosamine-undecaprenyl-phosphate N-acetylgalactosaminephosphotransferase [Clostridium pasteurianum DSM 525 = ATCC 6013]AJA51763.1 UDP-N-acetylgalactosamine-undecaprenyl-phosphate N-acetylgalactosaminephosphotransferase [Clostridium pasteurianum DSM 525 = ATCC 6013]AOZ75072.1 sugar transferase [Clostridium pasteurianum DSM 525 = ATCC 6013]AOZ78867.1 sugar transferase [Clostridium pasteurianum]ELP59676.1 sugar transferase 
MKKNTSLTNLYELLFTIVDIILVILAIYLSYMIKFNFNPPKFNYDPFIITAPFTIIIYLIFMYVYGLSDLIKQSIGEIIYSVFLTIIMLCISTMAVTFFLRAFSYPRMVILYSSIIQIILLSLWKVFVWKIKRTMYGKKDVIIVGDVNAEHVAKKILFKQSNLYNIKYICHPDVNNLFDLINKVEIVILCDDIKGALKDNILDKCLVEQKSILIVPAMSDLALVGSKLNKIDDLPLLRAKSLSLTAEEKVIKRILDIILTVIGIVIASPFMIIVAISIKLSDGGNVFYKQERVTEGGRNFNVIKFRSMKMNAEKLSGPVLATDKDPRITSIGRIIRATRMDELPQLFNILVGDMSIVGPRPERPFYVDKFEKEIPDYKYRTVVKAGLTGLAQVLGKYNTTPEDKVRYDIMYIKNYSILLDIKLIFQTIKIIFLKESTEGVREEIPLSELIKNKKLDIEIYK